MQRLVLYQIVLAERLEHQIGWNLEPCDSPLLYPLVFHWRIDANERSVIGVLGRNLARSAPGRPLESVEGLGTEGHLPSLRPKSARKHSVGPPKSPTRQAP